MSSEPRFRSGRPPHDAVNGLRVGALAGGAVGVLIVWVLSVGSIWPVFAGAVVGGAVGYITQRRQSQL